MFIFLRLDAEFVTAELKTGATGSRKKAARKSKY